MQDQCCHGCRTHFLLAISKQTVMPTSDTALPLLPGCQRTRFCLYLKHATDVSFARQVWPCCCSALASPGGWPVLDDLRRTGAFRHAPKCMGAMCFCARIYLQAFSVRIYLQAFSVRIYLQAFPPSRCYTCECVSACLFHRVFASFLYIPSFHADVHAFCPLQGL
jgi:hypothetical protein